MTHLLRADHQQEGHAVKAFVIYDSTYGNTKSVADAIAGTMKALGAKAVSVTDFSPRDLSADDLLVVGSPIQGWRPTPKITDLLASLANQGLDGVKAAAFDTRIRLFIHGDAAKKMTDALKKGGAEIISKPMAFYVKGTEGPLSSGEVERAASWAEQLLTTLHQ